MRTISCLVGFFGVGLAGMAQTPTDFSFALDRTPGSTSEVTVVGSWRVDGIEGWTWGACHDPASASIADCRGSLEYPCEDCPSIICPYDLVSASPAFLAVDIYEGGVTQVMVVDSPGGARLAARNRFEMLKVRYELAAEEVRVDPCETLGSPAVGISYTAWGINYAPATKIGTTLKKGPCPELTMRLGPAQPGAPPSDATVPVLLDTGHGHEIYNFQFGIAHREAAVAVTGVEEGAAIRAIGGTDIFIFNAVEGGVTAGAVLVTLPGQDGSPAIGTLPACTGGQEIARVTYSHDCEREGASDVAVRAVLTGTLGTPPVGVSVGVAGQSFAPWIGRGSSFTLSCAKPFIRGDATQDAMVNLSDAASIARGLFGLGSKFEAIKACKDAADANDDGLLNVADAVYILQYLFSGGPLLPPPNACGYDTTPSKFGRCTASVCD